MARVYRSPGNVEKAGGDGAECKPIYSLKRRRDYIQHGRCAAGRFPHEEKFRREPFLFLNAEIKTAKCHLRSCF